MTDGTVVLVGRDEPLLDGVRQVLGQHGLQAVIFHGFEPARSYLHQHAPQALVTDVQLGQYNGLHLVLLAHHWNPGAAAFVYSADEGNLATREDAMSCGAVYVHKADLATILVSELLQPLTRAPVS